MNGNQPGGQSRLDILKKLFAQIDLNQDQNLSFSEFHQFLSKKAGREFSEELLGEIFRTIDRDKNSVLNLNEFVEGFSKAESIILGQIAQVKARISENSENYTNAQRNLVEAKAKKLQNSSENSLYVVVKKAEGLKPGGVTGNKAPVVLIHCEGNSVMTTPVPNPTNPEWNQSFTFPIESGTGDIVIEVWDTERGKNTIMLGEVAIPINALDNQELHEDWLEIKNKSNYDKVQGRILVSLQWIYDLPVYLDRMIADYEAALKEDKAELETLEMYLRDLLAPIKHTTQLPEWVKSNAQIENVERKVSENVNNLFEKTLGNRIKWPRLTMLCVYSFVFLSILSMFFRTDFLNVISTQISISTSALLFYMKQLDLPLNFRIITIAILISQFFDVIWLFINFSVTFTQHELDTLFRSIGLIIILVHFVSKFAFGAVFWKNSIDLS